MVTLRNIQHVCDQIVREFHPQKIILFGSYAHGTQRPDSDVDLLVIMPCKDNPVQMTVAIRRAVHPGFPMDVLVRTPEMIRQRLEWEDFFIREIVAEGKVLYEASDK